MRKSRAPHQHRAAKDCVVEEEHVAEGCLFKSHSMRELGIRKNRVAAVHLGKARWHCELGIRAIQPAPRAWLELAAHKAATVKPNLAEKLCLGEFSGRTELAGGKLGRGAEAGE